MPTHKAHGADGEGMDCFLGPDLDSRIVYVVDQSPPGGRGFDEHKAMIGFKSEADAKQAYLDSYSDGFGAEIFRDLTPMSVDEFREWLADGNQTRPIADQYARGAADDEGGAFIFGEPESAEAYAKRYKPSAGQSSMFDESKHPRQADGEFAPKGGGSVHEAGGEDEEFSLSNPAPKHKPAEFQNTGGRQGKLLSGLNLLPGQQDLFAVDGEEAEKPAGKELWQMTKAEYRHATNGPKVEAIKKAIANGERIQNVTQTRGTLLASPDHIRMTASGRVEMAEGRTDKFVGLTDGQVNALARQAGMDVKEAWQEGGESHENHIREALESGKTVPPEVLADYPHIAQESEDAASDEPEDKPQAKSAWDSDPAKAPTKHDELIKAGHTHEGTAADGTAIDV